MSKEKSETKPEPNIIFVGEPGKEQTGYNNSIAGKVELPPVEEQKKPFYHEKAGEICRVFRGLYKPFKNKGEK